MMIVQSKNQCRTPEVMIRARLEEQAMMEDKQEWGCDCKTFKECNPQKKEKGSCCLLLDVEIEIENSEYREDQIV